MRAWHGLILPTMEHIYCIVSVDVENAFEGWTSMATHTLDVWALKFCQWLCVLPSASFTTLLFSVGSGEERVHN